MFRGWSDLVWQAANLRRAAWRLNSRNERLWNIRFQRILLKRPIWHANEASQQDSSCDLYLAFTAFLMAGLDGINRIEPGKPIDKNLYDLPRRR